MEKQIVHRKIIHIDEEKCNGCELCVNACHESAIEMVDGKARLVSDEYCDGLGDCLPECPTGAITMTEREAAAYDDDAVQERVALMNKEKEEKKQIEPMACGCPGSEAKEIKRKAVKKEGMTEDREKSQEKTESAIQQNQSELRQWPVQLGLISSNAQYLNGANLLVAADCTAYAYANFHKDFIKNHITVIACPKLDDNQYNINKLTEILENSDIKSITVVRMSVPCCGGIVHAVKTAMLNSQKIVPYKEVTISTEGEVL